MKIRLLTHIADADGCFPVVLAKTVFQTVEYDLLTPDEVDLKVKEILPEIEQYDQVYITDLNISLELAQMIEQEESYRSKIKIIDHHLSKEHMNQFSFIEVVDELDGIKQCATSLFYQHLLPNYPMLNKPCFQTLVEYVRKVDTWTWQGDEDAKNIDTLFDLYGRDYFIEYLTNYVKIHETFSYDEKEHALFRVAAKKLEYYVEEMKQNIHFATLDGARIGIVFCERHTSDVGHLLAVHYADQIDFIMLLKISKNSVSLRADKEEIDVTTFAVKRGGGGHKHAAGFSLPTDSQVKILKTLYPDIVLKEEIL